MTVNGEDNYGGQIPEQPVPSSSALAILAYRMGAVEKALTGFIEAFDRKLDELVTREVLAYQFAERDQRIAALETAAETKEERRISLRDILYGAIATLTVGIIVGLLPLAIGH